MGGIRFVALENYWRIKKDKMWLLEDFKQNAKGLGG
jgi:hypothetical protein